MNFSALLHSRCPHRPRQAVLGVALAVLSVSAVASKPIQAPDRKLTDDATTAATRPVMPLIVPAINEGLLFALI